MMTQMNKPTNNTLSTLLNPAFYRALCDPTRLSLLGWLALEGAPRSVSEIADGAAGGIDLSVVSRHLAQLRDAGIVSAQRSGKRILYHVNASGVAETLRRLADAIEACCPVTASPRRPA
jgi:DNA-binding transcriptional ArsR family regulator